MISLTLLMALGVSVMGAVLGFTSGVGVVIPGAVVVAIDISLESVPDYSKSGNKPCNSF
jgi:hypothetical protein